MIVLLTDFCLYLFFPYLVVLVLVSPGTDFLGELRKEGNSSTPSSSLESLALAGSVAALMAAEVVVNVVYVDGLTMTGLGFGLCNK